LGCSEHIDTNSYISDFGGLVV
jgi:hypothetical protein